MVMRMRTGFPFLVALMPWFVCVGCSSVADRPATRVAAIPKAGAIQVSEHGRAVLEKASAALLAGDNDRAIELAAPLAAAEPRDAAAQLILGRALEAQVKREYAAGRVPDIDLAERCEFHLGAAVRLLDKDVDARLALGEYYELEGHLEAALASYESILRFAALDKRALVAAARVATELGEERNAARHFEALRAKPPVPTEVLLEEARCYMTLAASNDSGDRTRWLRLARRAFRDLGERQPKDARAPAGEGYCEFLLASESSTIDDTAKSRIRELYLEAARLAPEDPLPRYNLALFLESSLVGDPGAARDEYRATLARDASHVPSLLNLARLLWIAGEKDAARVYWRRVLPLLGDEDEKRRVRAMLSREP